MAMASSKITRRPVGGVRPLDDPEPAIQYKHRGIYESERFTAPRILFVLSRIATMSLMYSILVYPSSSWSISNLLSTDFFQAARPPSISPAELRLPFVSISAMEKLSTVMNMPITSAMIYLMMLGVSVQFCVYFMVWRRELLPMTGDGAAITTTLAAIVIDFFHLLAFYYLGERNPTWNAGIFRWMPLMFWIGLPIQFASDQSKHNFKENPKNQGKVIQQGLWSIVRAPNYTGFILWRTAQSVATLGWVLGLGFGYVNLQAYRDNSIPSIDQHMSRKYGKQFEEYKRQVPYKLIPGVY